MGGAGSNMGGVGIKMRTLGQEREKTLLGFREGKPNWFGSSEPVWFK